MTSTRSGGKGRPPAASRAMLQDAAFELFLEQGYARTTVEHITKRAGVSRNTFFNYFDAKGDVFWVELDEALTRFANDLTGHDTRAEPLPALRDVLLALGADYGPDSVPFVLTQRELIGGVHELQASAVSRFSAAARGIRSFLIAREIGADAAQAVAYAVMGACVAATQAWAAAGPQRGALGAYVDAAVTPVLQGYAESLATSAAQRRERQLR